jgi:hypothetical protein
MPSSDERMKQWGKFMFSGLSDPKPLLAELDSEDNELSVRERLAAGKYNTWQSGVVNEWLRRKSEERQSTFEARLEAREEETLAAAREANRIASRAERWAMYAAIAAVIALIISITNKAS